MKETQARMLEVKVQMGALTPFQAQLKLLTLAIAIDSERSTTLDAIEHGNQTFAYAIALSDVASCLFFVDVAALEVLERPAMGLSQGFGALAYLQRQTGDKALEILQQHFGLREVLAKHLHAIQVTKSSLKAEAIKTVKNAHDVRGVFL
jgi:hypothetical protein